MLIAYARISKSDGSQALDLQTDALLEAGILPGNIYYDKVSGKKEERVGLENCLKSLRSGDTLVVWKLDRLGRNLKHLIRGLKSNGTKTYAKEFFIALSPYVS